MREIKSLSLCINSILYDLNCLETSDWVKIAFKIPVQVYSLTEWAILSRINYSLSVEVTKLIIKISFSL